MADDLKKNMEVPIIKNATTTTTTKYKNAFFEEK